jgi:hypothetical protein
MFDDLSLSDLELKENSCSSGSTSTEFGNIEECGKAL